MSVHTHFNVSTEVEGQEWEIENVDSQDGYAFSLTRELGAYSLIQAVMWIRQGSATAQS